MGNSLARGLRDALPAVRDAADDLVAQANRAAKAKAQIKSPSKVWIGYGRYMGEGLAIGLMNMQDSVSKAANRVVNSANTAMTDTVSKIQDMINASIDTQPVIRPVVDLSDVQASMRTANTMFSCSSSVSNSLSFQMLFWPLAERSSA